MHRSVDFFGGKEIAIKTYAYQGLALNRPLNRALNNWAQDCKKADARHFQLESRSVLTYYGSKSISLVMRKTDNKGHEVSS